MMPDFADKLSANHKVGYELHRFAYILPPVIGSNSDRLSFSTLQGVRGSAYNCFNGVPILLPGE